MKGSFRAAEAWHSEKPRRGHREGEVTVAVEDPGWKGSCKEVELGIMKKSYSMLLIKGQARYSKGP